MKAFLDFIPLLVFFYLFKTEDVFVATQGLLLSTTAVYALHFGLQKGKLEKAQWITLFLTVGFGALTLLLHDDIYIRWKSTVINWLFGFIFIIGNYISFGKGDPKALTERMLGSVFEMSHAQWKKLAWVWAAYFFVLGGIHLWFAFIWPEYWIDFKVFGSMAITLAFFVGNFVFLRKFMKQQP